jgi:hypothetical protein
MNTPVTDEERILIVEKYHISGLSQDAFCEELRASQGIHLAPRTLRAWSKRFGQPTNPADACVQIVSQAIQRLQGILDALDAGNPKTAVPGASQVAAGPAAMPETRKDLTSASPTEAACSLPTGMPGGNARAPIEFMPPEEPGTPEQPPRPRKGRVVWEV